MWQCAHCSKQTEDDEANCWHCGQAREGGSAVHTPAAMRTEAAMRRFRAAYDQARMLGGLGSVIMVMGVLITGFLLVMSFRGMSGALGFSLLIQPLVVGGAIAILGLLVAAASQILLATLATAVHTSPFLSDEQRAEILSRR